MTETWFKIQGNDEFISSVLFPKNDFLTDVTRFFLRQMLVAYGKEYFDLGTLEIQRAYRKSVAYCWILYMKNDYAEKNLFEIFFQRCLQEMKIEKQLEIQASRQATNNENELINYLINS